MYFSNLYNIKKIHIVIQFIKHTILVLIIHNISGIFVIQTSIQLVLNQYPMHVKVFANGYVH